MSSENILLVEGNSDRDFFGELCNKLGIDATFRVVTPKDLAGTRNGKEKIFEILRTQMLPNLIDRDDPYKRLAVVVDADHASAHGLGYAETLVRFSSELAAFGYKLNPEPTSGLIFSNDDGLADIGLWIMPNNADDGMLEDWIKACIHPNEKELLDHVNQSIDSIPDGKCKFKEYHKTKAEVATWLAWQKKPGHGLYNAINQQDLLNSANFKNLVNWLQNVFNQ